MTSSFELEVCILWSGKQDLNLRPSGPKPDALPNCATPRRKESAAIVFGL